MAHQPCQKADLIADHIEGLTAQYEPIDVQAIRNQYPGGQPRRLTQGDVTKAIKAMKIPKGKHPSDLPGSLLKSTAIILAPALTKLLNVVLATAQCA